MDLDHLLNFVSLTHQFGQIDRAMLFTGTDRHENDLEHTAQLALIAMYVAEQSPQPLDTGRVAQLALVHDLVEIHAGDTFVYGSDEHTGSQADREAAAIAQLKADWPNATAIHDLIQEYETHTTPEAMLVYSLDKLVPMLNNYLDNGASWQKEGITFDQVRRKKSGKADLSPIAAPLFTSLMNRLANQPSLFETTAKTNPAA